MTGLPRRGLLQGAAWAAGLGLTTTAVVAGGGSGRGPLGDMVNAADYGAVGDGRTDDTEALQRAFDVAIRDRNGGLLVIPPGRYRVTRGLRIETRDKPEGNITQACMVRAHGARIISAIRRPEPVLELISNSVVRFLTIEGLQIQGNGREGHGLALTCIRRGRYIYNFCLRDVIVQGCGGDGCRMWGNIFEGQVFNCYFRDNKGNGATLSHGPQNTVLSAIHVYGSVFGGNGVHGVAMVEGAADVGFNGCYFLLNGQYGLSADRGVTLLSHCGFENNHQDASSFEEGGAGIRLLVRGTLIGCTAYSIYNQTHLIRTFVTDELVMVGCTGYGGEKARRAGLARLEGTDRARISLLGCVGRVDPVGKITIAEPGNEPAQAFAGSWDSPNLLQIGEHRLWVDRRGKLRIKAGSPLSDEDGSPVSG